MVLFIFFGNSGGVIPDPDGTVLGFVVPPTVGVYMSYVHVSTEQNFASLALNNGKANVLSTLEVSELGSAHLTTNQNVLMNLQLLLNVS